MIHAELRGGITITNPPAVAGAVAVGGERPIGVLSVDSSVTGAAQPRSTLPVVVGLDVLVGGHSIPGAVIVGPVTVSRSLDSHLQTAEVTLAVLDSEGVFGPPLDFYGPPFGRAPIDVYGLYRVGGTTRRFPLLRFGVVNDIVRSGNPEGGYVERYTIADYAGAIDKRVVTLTLPAGHGLDRAAILQRLFSQLGVTRFALQQAGRVSKISEWVDADPFRAAQTLLEPAGRCILFDVSGALANPRIGPVQGPPRWRFSARDVLAGTDVSVTVPCDVVTDVTLTTAQQITSDPAAIQGLTTALSHSWVEQPYQPAQAGFRQAADCTTAVIAPPPDSPRLIKVSETYGSTESLGAVVIAERSEAWAWRQLEAARYVWLAGGVRSCRPDVYLAPDANPAGGGQEPAYAEQSENWRIVSSTTTHHYYDEAAYAGPASLSDTSSPWGNHFDGNAQSSRTGYKLGEVTDVYGWGFVGHALKQKVIGQTWQDTDPIVSLLTSGSGDGVTAEQEVYGLRSRQVVAIDSTPSGQVLRTTTYTFGWASPALAGDYFFSSGSVSDQAEEVFDLVGVEVVDYVVVGGSFRTVTTRLDYTQGRSSPQVTYGPVTAGAPPAVDRLPSNTPDSSIYLSPEEAAGAQAANPAQTQNIKVNVIATDLEERNWKGVYKTEAPYAESIDELSAMAKLLIQYSAAARISWQVSVNFDLREGDPVWLTYQPLAVDHLLQVHQVVHTIDPAGISSTAIEARRYPE